MIEHANSRMVLTIETWAPLHRSSLQQWISHLVTVAELPIVSESHFLWLHSSEVVQLLP